FMWGGHVAHRVSFSNYLLGTDSWNLSEILEVLASIDQNLLLTIRYCSFWSIPPNLLDGLQSGQLL
ncbi:MAG: hypothetical protein ACPK85_11975, partial [Methanosarcina sp.]